MYLSGSRTSSTSSPSPSPATRRSCRPSTRRQRSRSGTTWTRHSTRGSQTGTSRTSSGSSTGSSGRTESRERPGGFIFLLFSLHSLTFHVLRRPSGLPLSDVAPHDVGALLEACEAMETGILANLQKDTAQLRKEVRCFSLSCRFCFLCLRFLVV